MPKTYMFDAYGTLFDVHSAVMKAGAPLGEAAAAFSKLWRAKQLEYTWTCSMMQGSGMQGNGMHGNGMHGNRMQPAGGEPRIPAFDELTARALDFAIAAHGIDPPGMRAELLRAYQVLDAYPEVAGVLADLRMRGHGTAIFTNGTRRMVDAAIAAAGLGALLDHVVTVEPTNRYKPDPVVYAHALDVIGNPAKGDVIFVSSNRWDVAGATHFGFASLWVNRTRQPNEYPGLEPVQEVSDLRGVLSA